jgi:hypothetical protein
MKIGSCLAEFSLLTHPVNEVDLRSNDSLSVMRAFLTKNIDNYDLIFDTDVEYPGFIVTLLPFMYVNLTFLYVLLQ